jgi:multicomponent K+:H+ antiporter subunit A
MARLRRYRDFAVAVACGAGIAMVAYVTMTSPVPETIADFFLERAYSEGGGTNVVNVILVDFRGLDTFGEIAVLGIVALTIFALLRRFRPAPDSIGVPEQQRIQNDYDKQRPDREIGETVRDYLLCRPSSCSGCSGHHRARGLPLPARARLPGGGFAAGIAMAIGFWCSTWRRHALGGGHACASCRCAGSLRPGAGGGDRDGLWSWASLPHLLLPVSGGSVHRQGSGSHGPPLRPRRVLARRGRHGADPHRPRASVDQEPPGARHRGGKGGGGRLMELVLSLGIGVLVGSGVWLLVRPRTYQVIIGLALLSYAVNLFIFSWAV